MMRASENIVVKKFGGTSLGSLERIEKVAELIKEDFDKGQKPLVVASAMSGRTNELVEMARKIDSPEKGVAYDMLLSSGEQVSVSLLSLALEKKGVPSTPFLGHQLEIQTDSFFSKARILKIKVEKISDCIKEGQVPLVAGFQGVAPSGKITTLGRGGSDITAVALAVALKLKSCEIYTDVPYVFNADPFFVPEAKKMPTICYEDMMEMASLGSKVLHCRSVELAAKHGLCINVLSSFDRKEKGTWVVPQEKCRMEGSVISAVCHQKDVALIKLLRIPKGEVIFPKLFEKMASEYISVDVITQNLREENVSLSFSVGKEDLSATKKIISQVLQKDQATFLEKMAKISIVGVGMASHTGVAFRFFKTFEKENVEIILLTTSEIKISAIIAEKDLSKIAKALHKEFKL